MTTNKERIMKVIQTYSDSEFKRFDVFSNDDVMIAYYYEHFVHPETKEKFNTSVFEIYYDYDTEYDEFTTSEIIDNIDDFEEKLELIDEEF
jgi:hypothetical protein